MFNPNTRIGILGGGQLGQMLIQAAIPYNYFIKILDPDAEAPCRWIASVFEQGKLTDFDTVLAFGKDCDVLTIEIENVNTEALAALEAMGKKVFPQPHLIKLIQDKRIQKQFYATHQIPTADFILTENRTDVLQKITSFGFPVVQKLGKEGYDGRGVMKITSLADAQNAFEAPSLLERMVDIDKEISIIMARNENGDIKAFPPVEVVYHPKQNLVDYLIAPASITDEVAQKAQKIAEDLIQKLDFVGLLAVEMFVDKEQNVLVNEIAPRPHNSGHQSIEGNMVSQYEQHLRAILNLPLGETSLRFPCAMVNVLGADGFAGDAVYEGLDEVMRLEGVYVHLYGKKKTKPFRKMGHICIVAQDRNELLKKIQFVQEKVRIIAQ